MKLRFRLVAFFGALSSLASMRAQTVVTWANVGTDFATSANWIGGLPVNDATSNIIAFNSSVPIAQPVLAGAYSIAGVQFSSGAGQFTLSGTGPLTVGASGIENQTASGTQTVSVPLVFGGSGVSLTNQGTLQISGPITNSTTTGLTLTGLGNGGTISGQISGTGNLIKDGTGVWVLSGGGNPYSGSTSIAAGLLIANNSAGSATGSGNVTIAQNATLQIGFGGTTGSVSGAVIDNGTIFFSRSDNVTFGNGISGTGGINQGGTGTITLAGTNTYSGQTAIGTQSTSGHLTDAAAGSLSPNSFVSIYGGGLDVNFNETIKSLGDLTINSTTSFGTVAIASGATLTLTGGSSFSGTVSGAGTLSLASGASETFAGNVSVPTTIQSGAYLQVGNGGTTGTLSGVISNSGILAFKRSDAITYGGLSGTGSLNQNGTGTLTLTDTNSYTGSTQINSGTLADSAAGSFSPSSVISLNASGATLNVNNNETIGGLGGGNSSVGSTTNLASGATLTLASPSQTYNGTVAGSGALAVTVKGSETLGGANTYTGGTSIANAVLVATNTSGSATGTGTVTISGGTLQLGLYGAGGAVSGNIVDNGNVLFTSSDTSTYGGIISGSGTLSIGTINSPTSFTPGTFVLTGANSYTGLTMVNSGTLRIGVTNALPTSGTVSINSQGTLDVANDQTIARLFNSSTSGSILLGSGKTLTVAPTASTYNGVLNGTISGAGALTFGGVAGSRLTLAGNNTFSGGMTIAGGNVYVRGAQSLGTGAVTVQSAGTLLVDPAIWSDVTLSNNVSLAGNATIGSSHEKANLTLSGNVVVPTGAATVHVSDFLILSGSLAAASGSSSLTFDSAGNGFGTVVMLAAPSPSITSLTASKAGLIFGSASAVPTTGLSVQAATGYVGIAAVPGLTTPTAASVLSLIPNRAAFAGTLGFDTGTDTAPPANFADALDLTGFGSNFTLGSVTQAVLSGPITPPATGYAFGNGGGALIVTSPLTGNYDVTVSSTTQIPQNYLTLALLGNNTFTGNMTVSNSLVVLDSASAIPVGKQVALGANGYLGYTELFTGTTGFADFIANRLGSYTASSVIGLDSKDVISSALTTPNPSGRRTVTETLDLSSLGPIYLGTTTSALITGTIIAPNQNGANKTLSLLAAGDGVLAISSPLGASDVSQVVVGSTSAPYATGRVLLLNSGNTYTGGTELLSGTLVADGKSLRSEGSLVAGPIGTGALVVPGGAQKAALIAGGSNARLDNSVTLGSTLQLGVSPSAATQTNSSGAPVWESAFASTQLWLNGIVSDLDATHPGGFDVLGTTTLNGANTFSGGVTLEPGANVTIGDASALGSGPLTINTFDAPVTLQNDAGAVTLNNPIIYTGNPGYGLNLWTSAPLTLSGNVTLNSSLSLTNWAYSSPGAITITGAIGGGGRLTWNGTSALYLSPSGTNTFSGGIESGSGSIILSNPGAIPASPYNGAFTASGVGYLGIGFVPTTGDLQSTFIDRFNKGGTTGAIGFDSPSLASPNIFNSPIDLRSFTGSTSLGSATTAILGSNAIITPTANNYLFGGGGGLLEVQSSLVDATGLTTTARNVAVIGGSGVPLTVRLTGTNSYSGSTIVSGGGLVFGANALPATATIQPTSGAYVGTENLAFASNPNGFISRVSSGTFRAIVGFDSFTAGSPYVVTAPISLANFVSTSDPQIFLGTTTAATISGTVTLPSTQTAYRFAGYKGGQLTVATQLTSGSVVIGDSSNLATGGVNGFGNDMLSTAGLSGVTLTGSNSYSGGTVLNAGALYLGNNNALGTGALSINSDSSAPYRALLTSGGARTISNAIWMNGSVAIGGDYDLSLTGNISGSGELGKVGASTLTLSGNNASYSGFVDVAKGSLVYQTGNSVGSIMLQVESGASVTFADNSTVNGLYGGSDGSGGVVNLTAGKTLLIQQSYDTQFGGTFAGTTAGLSFDSTSTGTTNWMRLAGASTYSGPTTILSGGAVIAANANAFGVSTNQVTLNGGKLGVASGVTLSNPLTLTSGKIGGLGTFMAPAGGGYDIKSGLVLSPGFGLGGKLSFDGSLLSTATLTLNAGGTYDWHLLDTANSTAGWDTVAVNGTVNIAATSTVPFNVNVISVSPNGTSGLVSNFDPTHPYSWSILSATSITGFTGSNQFNLALNFANTNSGIFSLGLDPTHTNLLLTFNPVPEPSTYALLLAGAGLIWFASRRRARG